MLLDPNKLEECNLSAVFTLSSLAETKALGAHFAGIALAMPESCVGFIAPATTGKTALVSGIYKGLGLNYTSFCDMMVGLNGINSATFNERHLMRHFDMVVSPEDESHLTFPTHWTRLHDRAEAPALDLVEHAAKFRGNNYDFVFKLTKQEDGKRGVEFYCADEHKGHCAVQDFLRDGTLIPEQEPVIAP